MRAGLPVSPAKPGGGLSGETRAQVGVYRMGGWKAMRASVNLTMPGRVMSF